MFQYICSPQHVDFCCKELTFESGADVKYLEIKEGMLK